MILKRILELPFYFGVLLFLLLCAAAFNIYFSKLDGFMILNSIHNTWLDTFFKFFTNLGDGLFCLLIVVLLFVFGKKKESVTILIAYITSGLAAQILKRLFHMPRPKVFFEQIAFHYPHFVEGVRMSGTNSFPSGHTTSAFALATVIALVYKKRRISLGLIAFAVLVSYSRIYLAQHFLQDVIFGAVTGIIFALVSYDQIYDQKLWSLFKLKKYRNEIAPASEQAL